MKKDKGANSPPSIPQMALFETEPESPPAAAAKAGAMVAMQPEPELQNPAILAAPTGEKSSKPRRSSKPASKPMPIPKPAVVAHPESQSPPQTAPGRGKASGSSAVPAGDVRLTANIRQDLHLKLKIAAARQRTTIGELIEQWVENLL